ncbi:NAD(P)/FAD-dependent oxidoreductase [Paenibacillus nanensis]|uniref:Ferredoxin--NADP reductase n=1 Tax=Paenibacillus nanensis TaxID=393251 RepID=A0A3A1VLU6_9BACL|nr:NAD(P)/FAD-dependent oxidoreductase [Paenibacillus nanensis]RIX60616.1 NAD(P)/FAD-dependent oxidoreductase [Paenibacillus nanensis]
MGEQLELYDVTIIGGGPAGLYTAFYSGMRELKTKLIEAQDQLGGRMLLYPEKIVWDVGGVTPIRAEKLLEQIIQQGMTFDPTIVMNEQIVGLDKREDGTFLLTAASGAKHHTKAVIMACGYGIRKLAKLEIEGADRYEVTNLYYTVQDLGSFRGKRVLISGGGDSAVDWANELVHVASSVTVVHRRDSFGGLERNVTAMKHSADVRTPYTVKALHSADGKNISQVSIQHVETGEESMVEVDAVIVSHGMRSDFGPIRNWGFDMGEWKANVSPKMETNIPGVFGAGDFVGHESKVGLIAGAFTDAVLALNSAKVYMDPEASPYAYVSSHNDRFKDKNKELEKLQKV